MDDDQYKRYENIDALIKAAEVLERNEINHKNQMTFNKKKKIRNVIFQRNSFNYQLPKINLNYLNKRHLNCQSKGRISDSLMQTIQCIKELRNDERWYSLIENKLKSDNRALSQELNHLKRKLNKIKHMAAIAKKNKSINKSYEDEDTSTASEDEDYNKYGSRNAEENMDDVTDDASECEETSQFSQNGKIYNMKHIAKEEAVETRNIISEHHSNGKNLHLSMDRKPKHKNHAVLHSSDLSHKKHSNMTLSNSIWNNCNTRHGNCGQSVSVSQFGLIEPSTYKLSSKVHYLV